MSSRRLDCKVICVGNICVGGTGKTPMTMYVARAARLLGYRPAIVSRGYRGGAEGQGGIVGDGKSIVMGPEMAGDEPYMMACRLAGIPVVVNKNRYAAGKLAIDQFHADLIVLDDGFQHLKLKRDTDLVLLDCARPFGNFHLLPRGPLREPKSALDRASACILTRCPVGGGDAVTGRLELIRKHWPHTPVFTSSHNPYCYVIEGGETIPSKGLADRQLHSAQSELKTEAVYGFCGIARNDAFRSTVKTLGFDAKGFLEFSDHHRYSAPDIDRIRSSAEKAGARHLITTEKDLVRLLPRNPFARKLFVIGVEISFGDCQSDFLSFLARQLSR